MDVGGFLATEKYPELANLKIRFSEVNFHFDSHGLLRTSSSFVTISTTNLPTFSRLIFNRSLESDVFTMANEKWFSRK
jgi:hypothetical protein